eukprot:5312888-Amphidinium_carterae.1
MLKTLLLPLSTVPSTLSSCASERCATWIQKEIGRSAQTACCEGSRRRKGEGKRPPERSFSMLLEYVSFSKYLQLCGPNQEDKEGAETGHRSAGPPLGSRLLL